jgi:hypothetical protein
MVKGLIFDELSTEAKEKVKDTYRSELNDALDRKVLIVIGNRMKAEGISSLEDVNFSLNECEGDGIAFYGELDIDAFLKGLGLTRDSIRNPLQEDAYVTIVPEKGTIYHNRNTMVIQSGGCPLDFLVVVRDRLMRIIKELEIECYEIMQNEDKILRELVECYEFDKNGEEI